MRGVWEGSVGGGCGRGGVTLAHLTDLFKPSCDVGIRAHL